MGGVIFFLVIFFFFARGGFQFVFIKAYTTFAISGVRRGLGDKGGILGIFFPCIGINKRTNIVGLLLSDSFTANIAQITSRQGGGDGFFHAF